jgi:hypothetical protein
VPSLLATLLVLNRMLDFYERLERRRRRPGQIARRPLDWYASGIITITLLAAHTAL